MHNHGRTRTSKVVSDGTVVVLEGVSPPDARWGSSDEGETSPVRSGVRPLSGSTTPYFRSMEFSEEQVVEDGGRLESGEGVDHVDSGRPVSRVWSIRGPRHGPVDPDPRPGPTSTGSSPDPLGGFRHPLSFSGVWFPTNGPDRGTPLCWDRDQTPFSTQCVWIESGVLETPGPWTPHPSPEDDRVSGFWRGSGGS